MWHHPECKPGVKVLQQQAEKAPLRHCSSCVQTVVQRWRRLMQAVDLKKMLLVCGYQGLGLASEQS